MSGTTEHAKAAPDEGLLLPGLDGTNPLGFLAALGLFRVIDALAESVPPRLQWLPENGTWVPRLLGTGLTECTFLELLERHVATKIAEHPVLRVLKALGESTDEERTALFMQLDDAEWLAALAGDAVSSDKTNQLQTPRRDYFYGNLESVIAATEPDHLRRAILSPWDYADPLDNQSLHIDPSEDRRHAHQWNRPSGDPDKKKSGGMLGANRLAIEAIPLFTSIPYNDTLRTIGFTGLRSRDTRWTWPLWDAPLTLPVVRSLLTLHELQDKSIDPGSQEVLRHRGVAAVFRTCRILVGKTPNFTPAQRIA
jgi:CRISPR-associated endonuclease/helicase Cas3